MERVAAECRNGAAGLGPEYQGICEPGESRQQDIRSVFMRNPMLLTAVSRPSDAHAAQRHNGGMHISAYSCGVSAVARREDPAAVRTLGQPWWPRRADAAVLAGHAQRRGLR